MQDIFYPRFWASHQQMCELQTGCLVLLNVLFFCPSRMMYGHSWPPSFPAPHKQLIALLCPVAHFLYSRSGWVLITDSLSGSWVIDLWVNHWITLPAYHFISHTQLSFSEESKPGADMWSFSSTTISVRIKYWIFCDTVSQILKSQAAF